jgi:hypothetical protein
LKYNILIILGCIAITCFNCKNDDFSPYGEFQKKIIMSGVLDSRSKNQFVKVQHTYLSLNSNPDDTSKSVIKNLKVYISTGNKDILLKDTLIMGLVNYKVFYTNELIPERGSIYTLRAESSDFPTAQSTVKIPAVQYIDIYTDELYIHMIFGAANTKGYLYGLFLDYEVVETNKTTKYTIEIPLSSYSNPDNIDEIIQEFPELTKDRGAKYPLTSLTSSLISIAPTTPNKKIKIKKAYGIVYSFDENLYNYILSVGGFNDPYSVRLDEPFYSNIRNGYGLFGSIVADTQKFNISSEFIKSFNYIDDQQ